MWAIIAVSVDHQSCQSRSSQISVGSIPVHMWLIRATSVGHNSGVCGLSGIIIGAVCDVGCQIFVVVAFVVLFRFLLV